MSPPNRPAALWLAAAFAVHPMVLPVDASHPPPPPETGYFQFGTARTPAGDTLGINSQYLTLNGRPWLPVMGEFHYARFPARYWEEELLKMKAAGVSIVSTYVIWQYHEETAGHFDWQGDRDLRRFVMLCQKVGLYVFLRPGPWSHAEVRFGGIPDWVVDETPTRRNDPAYLSEVNLFFQQIAAQVKGLLWKDGGPVIGAQIENEYNLTGPGQGRAHIATLKRMLVQAGIDVPLYTVTGWDNTIYPEHQVTPVFGGYPDEPWAASTAKLPPKAVYDFQFSSRISKGLGAETEPPATGDAQSDMAHTPFLAAEFGGGVPTMYRRRPVIQPDDVAAMLPVQLGSGVNLYGYYMFQGGRNPSGSPSREENTAIGGYNDLPKIGYDFGAPLGEYGEQHPVLAKLRPFHYFLQEWGTDLAPMAVHSPATVPTSPADLTTPRFSVRSLGDRGFLFMSNHVRGYRMAAQTNVQFAVKLLDGTLIFPRTPVTIPPDAYFIWPINLDLGGATLSWGTVQPLTRIMQGDDPVYVFHAIDGIPVELGFDAGEVRSVSVNGGKPATIVDGGHLVASGIAPGTNALVTVGTRTGKTIRLLILTRDQAERSWVADWAGQSRLIETDAQLWTDDTALQLRSIGDPHFRFGIFPALARAPSADLALTRTADDGVFESFDADAPLARIGVTLSRLRDAFPVPPVRIGGAARAAIEPVPETFDDAAAWNVALTSDALSGDHVADVYLQIGYQGDIARLFSGATMLDDQFYDGVPWNIGLKRFAAEIRRPLTLEVLPLGQDAPIYLEDGMRPAIAKGGQVARVFRVLATPEYGLSVRVDRK